MHDSSFPDRRAKTESPSAPSARTVQIPAFRLASLVSLIRGRSASPAWERSAFIGLLGATGLLYLWNLAASGWANAYYSAAVLAGTKSWSAFFFGSLDASNYITVDKAPGALWVMEISARVFGFSGWSVLAPQALEGVATVAIVYLAVRRWSGPAAGLLAGGIVALTPVAALMFRFNNPDALLVLLLTLATYLTLRAVEDGRTRWLLIAGAAAGFAFLAKELQALIIVPALGGVYLLAGPRRLLRRAGQLLATAAVLVASGGWWVAIVQLTPASMRPYIGGSQDNSFLSVLFGYNGFGRLTGAETGSVGGGNTVGSMWGPTGWNRLFIAAFGGQVSWLIPGVLILLAAALLLTSRRPRTDLTRASLLAWGGTLLLTGGVISFAQGIIHPYYTVALAPAIGALAGIGIAVLWSHRDRLAARFAMGATLLATAAWAFVLLDRTPDWYPGLRYAVAAVGLVCAILFVFLPRLPRLATPAVVALCLAAAIAGPAAYTLDTAAAAHTSAIPSAGPAVAGGFGPGGFGPGGFAPGGAAFGARGIPAGAPGTFAPGGAFAGGPTAANGIPAGAGGGFLDATQPPAALVTLIETNASNYKWVVATINANSAAGYQLATGDPVMAIGGFNGSDPALTLARFQALVGKGQIHYFIGGGGGPSGGSSGSASAISAWVAANYTATTVGGTTIYDLGVAK
jgi:4-amino-4-deoxy-L-arabinose transferase-like glycosyltransferase